MAQNLDNFYEIATRAVQGVLQSMSFAPPYKGKVITDMSQFNDDDDLGFIVVMGPKINGAWAVYIDESFLQESYNKTTSQDLCELDDWLKEMTNRVVGATKAILSKYHVDCEMSTVLKLDKKTLVRACAPISPLYGISFNLGASNIHVFFSLVLNCEIDITMPPDEGAVIGNLGSSVIF
ncbi:MAG: hypothetical protein HQK54_01475 [Oligoflexales bacterium]|nr:hypothetical protein [Oligoflexales bacterium]